MTTMYKDKEAKELLELLSEHKALTFQSQLELQKELEIRGFGNEGKTLENTIRETATDIENFHYLKDLGFKFEESTDSLKITRTTKAIITDMVAIVLGLALSVYGLVQLLSITVFAPEIERDLSIAGLITIIIYGVMIIIGVRFLNGVKRFLDFLGFELSKSKDQIILKKRFDLKLEERQIEASSLQLKSYKGRTALKLDDDALLDANANDILQKKTIESLYNRLIK